MGKRGPKPKPKQLNILDGNPSRRPLVPDHLDISPDLPPVKPLAVEADPVANAEWDRLLRTMPDGLYTAADVSALSIYVLSWSMLWSAQAALAENGLAVLEVTKKVDSQGNETSSEKWKTNPALAAWRTAAENLHKSGDRLGLNPGVRARMGMPDRSAKQPGEAKPAGRARLLAG